MAKRYKNSEPDILSTIIVGIFKILWWLVSLPFKGVKLGANKKGLDLEVRNDIVAKRHEIEKLLLSENEIQLKHAVMEADKLVDHVLKVKGYSGDTFADRLRNAENSMSRAVYNNIWDGHKIRNQIAHEQGIIFSNPDLVSAANKLISYTKII